MLYYWWARRFVQADGGVAGRPDIRADVSLSKRFHFLGIPGRVFFKFGTGKVAKFYYCS